MSDCAACRINRVEHVSPMPDGKAILCLACSMPEDARDRARIVSELDAIALMLDGMSRFGLRGVVEQLPLGVEPVIPDAGYVLVPGHIGLGGPPAWSAFSSVTGRRELAWVPCLQGGTRLIAQRITMLPTPMESVTDIVVYYRRFDRDGQRFASAVITTKRIKTMAEIAQASAPWA